MLRHLAIVFIVGFWVTMNALLWHSEYGGGTEPSGAVPVQFVWQKILSAPDDSTLEIFRRKEGIGYCRWVPNVGQELETGKIAAETPPLEGRIKQPTGYTISLEGNLRFRPDTNSTRFSVHFQFTTNRVWTDFTFSIYNKLGTWQAQANAHDQTLDAVFHNQEMKWERSYAFAELQHPERLLADLGFPFADKLLGGQEAILKPKAVEIGLIWEAYNDWLRIGRSKGRVYRLQARLFDKFKAVVIVSRVGEILKVELPGDLVLVNDSLTTLLVEASSHD